MIQEFPRRDCLGDDQTAAARIFAKTRMIVNDDVTTVFVLNIRCKPHLHVRYPLKKNVPTHYCHSHERMILLELKTLTCVRLSPDFRTHAGCILRREVYCANREASVRAYFSGAFLFVESRSMSRRRSGWLAWKH